MYDENKHWMVVNMKDLHGRMKHGAGKDLGCGMNKERKAHKEQKTPNQGSKQHQVVEGKLMASCDRIVVKWAQMVEVKQRVDEEQAEDERELVIIKCLFSWVPACLHCRVARHKWLSRQSSLLHHFVSQLTSSLYSHCKTWIWPSTSMLYPWSTSLQLFQFIYPMFLTIWWVYATKVFFVDFIVHFHLELQSYRVSRTNQYYLISL